jgi:hypothetical protein
VHAQIIFTLGGFPAISFKEFAMNKIVERLMGAVLHAVSSWLIAGFKMLRVKYRNFLQTSKIWWSLTITAAFIGMCVAQIFLGWGASVPDGALYWFDDIVLGSLAIEPAIELFRRFARWLQSRGMDLPESTKELIEQARVGAEESGDKTAEKVVEQTADKVRQGIAQKPRPRQSA